MQTNMHSITSGIVDPILEFLQGMFTKKYQLFILGANSAIPAGNKLTK